MTANTILADLSVVEVSAFVAAPVGGMTLAQMGAEVIRIDPIGGNIDHGRWPLAPNGNSLYWASLNKGKKSVCLALNTPEGREILDGTAGLWCCNAGHGRREIVEAIQKQAAVMDFAPTFQLGHPIAFEAAARVAELTPEGMDRVFFVNSGSEAAVSQPTRPPSPINRRVGRFALCRLGWAWRQIYLILGT